MKFYSKPEIEALALETVDVIETSAVTNANDVITENLGDNAASVAVINQQVAQMTTDWQW